MRSVLSIFFFMICSVSTYADFPHPWQINFQDAATEVMEKVEWLHEFLMIVMSGIVVVVMFLIAFVCIRYNAKANPVPNKFTHNILIEIIWTIIPVILLVIIAIPSFRILYYVEHPPKADLTIKVVGYQWYWHYIYPDNGNFEFDSYMKQTKDLAPGEMRLLEVDNRVVLPAGKVVRILTTGADVIHSFAVPSFGIKMDAIPGKANETWIKVDKPGVYYGQCSELCGVNHGFMPIAVEIVPEEQFLAWVEMAKVKFK
jgi:cytochrome c oxidase subunit 2